jgi:hypothetical protein
MRLLIVGLFGAATLAAATAALACGACIEDKIAATYDHAVVTDAAARHRIVVFAAVDGPGEPEAGAKALAAAAAHVPGVDRASIRTAASPRALSFALDRTKTSPDKALAAIEAKSAVHGLKLALIRVIG